MWGVIIPVVGLCIIGWFWFSPTLYVDSWNPHHAPFFSAVGSSIAMTLWAFLGLESACANTDVVENPERNVPIAVLGGTLGAAVIYIVSTNVIAGIVPNMELANSTAPFGLAFAQMFTPEVGKVIMALMVMFMLRFATWLACSPLPRCLNLHLMKATSLKFSPV